LLDLASNRLPQAVAEDAVSNWMNTMHINVGGDIDFHAAT
jgi:hypothetical protein